MINNAPRKSQHHPPTSARPDSRVKLPPRKSVEEPEQVIKTVDLRRTRSIDPMVGRDPMAGKNLKTENQERCIEDELDHLVMQAKERFK